MVSDGSLAHLLLDPGVSWGSTCAASRVTRSPRRTKHSSVLSHLPIRVAQQCNGRERCTAIRLMTSGQDKQKDTDVKRDPSKNVGKVGAKAREKSKASMTRREEAGPTQANVVTTQ